MGCAAHLDMHAGKVGDFGGETTSIVNRTRWHIFWEKHAVVDGNTVIVLTEGGSLVDDTRAVVSCDIGIVENAECAILELYTMTQHKAPHKSSRRVPAP